MANGSLTVVGTGYRIAGQTTPEAQTSIQKADRVFYVAADPVTQVWLEKLNPAAESIRNCYAVGKDRMVSYQEMVDRILSAVRDGLDVCAVFYGHPGVCVYPAHEAIRRARLEGFKARMLPGISAEDCLFADLGVDPGEGCQSFEATDFLVRRRKFDPCSALILWQIGSIGVRTYKKEDLWNPEGVRVLVEVLKKTYPPTHKVVVYEAVHYPVCDPRIQRVSLDRVPKARVTIASTLYVPPRSTARYDVKMAARLGYI